MRKKFSIFHLSSVIYQRGFTFIELIVTFSVIAILSGVGIASFVSYSRSQELNVAASELTTVINLAKSSSASQVKPDICGDNAIENYEVRICGLGTQPSCVSSEMSGYSGFWYELDINCSGNTFSIPNYSKKLPKSIVFDSYPAFTTTTSIIFPVISGGVKNEGQIVLMGYGKKKTISINSMGIITSK